jgi:hypothetical protein
MAFTHEVPGQSRVACTSVRTRHELRAYRRFRVTCAVSALVLTAALGGILVEGTGIADAGTAATADDAPASTMRLQTEQSQTTPPIAVSSQVVVPAVSPSATRTTASPAPVTVPPSSASPRSAALPSSESATSIEGPLGVAGRWDLSFDDEFDGTALDTSRWSAMEGLPMNTVTAHASNVAVRDGFLVLTLASSTSGAYVSSAPFDIGGDKGYLLPVGGYAEARVSFPGNGATIYNWPAWWTGSGPEWPAGGEHDIAEGLGTLTVNYHDAGGAHNQGVVPGTWSNQFHIYGIHRAAGHADVYWDGRLVKSYPTDDNGVGQALLLNVGVNPPNGSLSAFGAASEVKVDYVRAWHSIG